MDKKQTKTDNTREFVILVTAQKGADGNRETLFETRVSDEAEARDAYDAACANTRLMKKTYRRMHGLTKKAFRKADVRMHISFFEYHPTTGYMADVEADREIIGPAKALDAYQSDDLVQALRRKPDVVCTSIWYKQDFDTLEGLEGEELADAKDKIRDSFEDALTEAGNECIAANCW
jgi:hypothetical protein